MEDDLCKRFSPERSLEESEPNLAQREQRRQDRDLSASSVKSRTHVIIPGRVSFQNSTKHSREGVEQEDSHSDRLCLIPLLFHHQSKHRLEIDTLFPINGFNTCTVETQDV